MSGKAVERSRMGLSSSNENKFSLEDYISKLSQELTSDLVPTPLDKNTLKKGANTCPLNIIFSKTVGWPETDIVPNAAPRIPLLG